MGYNYGITNEENDLDNDGLNNLFEYGIETGAIRFILRDGPQRLPKINKNDGDLNLIYYKRNDAQSLGVRILNIESSNNTRYDVLAIHGFDENNFRSN